MPTAFTTPRVFRERLVPPSGELVGYAALVQACGVDTPVRRASCVVPTFVKEGRQETPDWTIFGRRMRPEPTLVGHLTFALRHEALDLLLLKGIFDAIPAGQMEEMVASVPTGAWTRRAWFLFEWLTGRRLDLPDASTGNYADAIDPGAYFAARPRNSPRHRIRDNLPGTPDFCPVIRRTARLEEFIGRSLGERAREITGRVDRRMLARAASFLLLADSQASFQIEGERPPRNRIERWGRAVMQAGQRPLSVAELERLQSVIIEDERHIAPGIRTEGVFLGDRMLDGSPVPEFIGARPQDLPRLMNGIIAANARMSGDGLDPTVQAAALSFGFVMVHPFEDGNGRLHRFLIHHVLAERGFSPPGILFPVSTAILDAIEDYMRLLRAHSGPLMDHIEWRPTKRGNVEVVNNTFDLYAFFDVTDFAEFLYACVARTVEEDLPREIAHLRAYDRAKSEILNLFDMADARLSLLILFARQNGGVLPKKRRAKEFSDLSDDEVKAVEGIVQEAFDLPQAAPEDSPEAGLRT
jgi:Fic family protein